MQYLESVQHGLGVTVLPPMAIHPAAGQVDAIPITPPLHRDLCAVVAAGRPPTGPPRPYSTCSRRAFRVTPADAATGTGWARVWKTTQ